MNIAGYLIHETEGNLTGSRGNHYNYILGGNGVFIAASNDHLQAVVNVAPARIRGLAPVKPLLWLKHGRIPATLFGESLRMMMLSMHREMYLAVVWENGQYALRAPAQEASSAHVTYETLPNKVLDMHSHPTMSGRFSSVDNRDEVGFQLYGVIGHVDQLVPEYTFRVGVYGHFQEIPLEKLFE